MTLCTWPPWCAISESPLTHLLLFIGDWLFSIGADAAFFNGQSQIADDQ